MWRLSSLTVVTLLLGLALVPSAHGLVLAGWTFETLPINYTSLSGPIGSTDGPHAAEIGVGAAVGVHSSAATLWTGPVGDGTLHSWNSNSWGIGDYYQFQIATSGWQNIAVAWDQVSSGNGPRDFRLEYSTDGSLFSPFADYTNRENVNPNWSSVTRHGIDHRFFDLSSLSNLDNAPAVYFRLTDRSNTSVRGGAVLTSGASRVDEFMVTGDQMLTTVPEPTSVAFLVAGACALLTRAMRRRRPD